MFPPGTGGNRSGVIGAKASEFARKRATIVWAWNMLFQSASAASYAAGRSENLGCGMLGLVGEFWPEVRLGLA
jgi:hypothetical protein